MLRRGSGEQLYTFIRKYRIDGKFKSDGRSNGTTVYDVRQKRKIIRTTTISISCQRRRRPDHVSVSPDENVLSNNITRNATIHGSDIMLLIMAAVRHFVFIYQLFFLYITSPIANRCRMHNAI